MRQILTEQVIFEFEKNAVNFARGIEGLASVTPHILDVLKHGKPIVEGIRSTMKAGTPLMDVLKGVDYKKFTEGGKTIHSVKFNTGGNPAAAGRTMPSVEQMASASESIPTFRRAKDQRFTKENIGKAEQNIDFHNQNPPKQHEFNFSTGEGGFGMDQRSRDQLVEATKVKPPSKLKGIGMAAAGGLGLGGLALAGGAAAGAAGGLGN
jgi:hypothetical protein